MGKEILTPLRRDTLFSVAAGIEDEDYAKVRAREISAIKKGLLLLLEKGFAFSLSEKYASAEAMFRAKEPIKNMEETTAGGDCALHETQETEGL